MDLWIVVAAASAGYLAKNWQGPSRNRDGLAELSSGGPDFEKDEIPSCPFRKLLPRKKLGRDVSSGRKKIADGKSSDMTLLNGVSKVEVASTCGSDGQKLQSLGANDDCNLLYLSSVPPVFPTNKNRNENREGIRGSGDYDDSSEGWLPDPLRRETNSGFELWQNRSSLRRKRSYGHFVKPLNSLESCLLAQLYKEHAETEEYVLSALPSPSMPIRPLLITDGKQIISRGNVDLFTSQMNKGENYLHEENFTENNEFPLGIPPLRRKMKIKARKRQSGQMSSSNRLVNGKHSLLQGSPNDMLLCLGVSIGIIFSVIANKREVDKLKELLKQTENLVQDLQEELEMKDSLTVKELVGENYESQGTCNNVFQDRGKDALSLEQDMSNSTKYVGEESCDQKAEDHAECMSKIEAELEVELERLALTMTTSNLERRFSDLFEIDPDFVADFAQGEMRTDMVNGKAVVRPDTYKDISSTSTTHSANYAISPRELSLRLHEVIQSRLEERVKELETALQNSQKKERVMESESKMSWKEFSNSELRYSSTKESPTANEECNPMNQPLVMNLSGEALDAYNEAYKELMKMNESEEDESPSRVYENTHQEGLQLSVKPEFGVQNGRVNGFTSHLRINTENTSRDFLEATTNFSEHSLRIQELIDASTSRDDETSDYDDESEMLLIQQIVEKTKKGSPAVLNAQKTLFSIDEISY